LEKNRRLSGRQRNIYKIVPAKESRGGTSRRGYKPLLTKECGGRFTKSSLRKNELNFW